MLYMKGEKVCTRPLLWTCGSFKSSNHKKDWVRKSQSVAFAESP
jgi:hypothetical protein